MKEQRKRMELKIMRNITNEIIDIPANTTKQTNPTKH
jgi:hypothetical protein